MDRFAETLVSKTGCGDRAVNPDQHGDPLREIRLLMTLGFGKRARFYKCVPYITFPIPFQCHLAQHQERSCKHDLSITFTIL